MTAPQVVLLVWWATVLGVNAGTHGKTYTRKVSFFQMLGNIAISAAFLWWGGFWK
jgi:hypothetical protein